MRNSRPFTRTMSSAMLTCVLSLTACTMGSKAVRRTGKSLEEAGILTTKQAKSISDLTTAFIQSMEDITESQEYYIGRTLAAEILAPGRYRIYRDPQLTEYINKIGMTIAWASRRPILFAGYHFTILDSDEINAFACPGGFIFITRGMLALANDEEQLAAALAHEIAHVNLKHGLSAIKKSRFTALSAYGLNAVGEFADKDVKKVTNIFEASVGDMVGTLMDKGYSRSQEVEADRLATEIMHRAGYNPRGLSQLLDSMRKRSRGATDHRPGIFKTHPAPSDRKAVADHWIKQKHLRGKTEMIRSQRFRQETIRL